ncbi:SDR family NAD(P)-dependent oxidoreductase [Actinotalea sp. K2]|uniref:SDR family NAD(P)-dependent oxidoreductase n=1 Tax=Actinotalea sp. K2 TaxID=2939438 RepID=UPI002017AE00|nr:SDR family NAD(P)-dependent oxidoreductase [Actinotalea sp. K2]MCL3862112.1 SDR family NAD(P)-dependent oxidoreductase [Actinotalea sp. K2]
MTGASSGFGTHTARALADAGCAVHHGLRETIGRNAPQVQAAAEGAAEHDVESVKAAITAFEAGHGRTDIMIHNAGHMVVGPTEAFAPEQLAELHNVKVLSTQRVNRAAPPGMRHRGEGLVVWVSSSSVKGSTPPTTRRVRP